MLQLKYGKQFEKDLLRSEKRGLDISKLRDAVNILQAEKPLPPEYKDHKLVNSKKYKNARECHIEPDWLLIYRIETEIQVLELRRTGTHSDLY